MSLGCCQSLDSEMRWMTYRYAEMKVALSQLPFVNTVNPPVSRKRMHAANAARDV